MRLFTAINFDENTKNEIDKITKELKNYSVKGNFTSRENLHLTLVFIGETTPTKLKDIKQAMDEINSDEFEISIFGLGKFKRLNGDIYWIGVEDEKEENYSMLNSIYEDLSSKLKAKGFDIEDRKFQPHLTLGREVILKSGFIKSEFDKLFRPIRLKINKISLMQSERVENRMVYTELYNKNFI